MIKFLHMVCMLVFVALYLLSCFSKLPTTAGCQRLKLRTGGLLFSLLLSVVFGVLLVHQKGYYFSTPWIHAALIFSFILFFLILALFYLQRKKLLGPEFSAADRVRLYGIQLLSFVIIVAVAHDAVTKTTGLL